MCGIFGIVCENDAPSKVFAGLKDIEYRGYDSWGIAYWQDEDGVWKIEKEVGFLPSTLNLPSSELALGHTRWATHGGVTEENAHPHSDCSNRLVMVHNGIVENFRELKSSLKKHKFKSETDSEVIIHLIEEQLTKQSDFKKAISQVFKSLHGLNAIVVTNGHEIVACKNGSPLVVGALEKGFTIASDPNSLLPMTKKLLFLEDNQMVALNNKLELFEAKTLKKLPAKLNTVDWNYSNATLKSQPHFMIKEIYEQPQTLKNISKNSSEIERVARMVKKAYGTYFIACGSAAYSCLSAVYLFSKFAKRHVNFSIGSEFSYIEDYLKPESLLVAVSQSGETMDVVEPVTMAKKKGTKIVSLVNTLGSTLYRLADHPVLLGAGPEKAVCSTKALTAMVAEMIILSFTVADKKTDGQKIVEKSALEIERILTKTISIKRLAEKIYRTHHVYILGRGLSYPVSLESALKIKEITYIHSEGFAGGELKHGVIALIDINTPVIVFVPNDETKEAMLSNAMEVKARGAFVIGVGPENNPVFDFFYEVKDVGASSIIPHIVFAQLLAYFMAVKLGLNPDKPRNLAKSVVVR